MKKTNFEFRSPRVKDDALKSIKEGHETRLNIVIYAAMLKKLKQLALDKNITLRELVTEQLELLLNQQNNK